MGDMKFFIENQKIERELEWVISLVKLHMNGATTAQMENGGIHYRLNYGVGIPHLKQLSKRIPNSYELAERMWFQEIRETMILATIVVPADEMTAERCHEWAEKITNKDIVERSSMFLWWRLPVINDLLPLWFKSPNQFLKATGMFTFGRMIQNNQRIMTYDSSSLINLLNDKDELLVLKALSFAIRMNIRHQYADETSVRKFIEKLNASNDVNQHMIAEELISELEMLKDQFK